MKKMMDKNDGNREKSYLKPLESLAIMKLIDQRINKKTMHFIDDNLKF
jgi:hypothetical protein